MSDFETELAKRLSTPAGRNWMRHQIRDAISGQTARLERQCTINRLSSTPHHELRTAIEVAEIGEPDAHSIKMIEMLNEALDLKGRTTKDEAARLSPFGVSFLLEVKYVYYRLDTKTMIHYNRTNGKFEKITSCSHEYSGVWKPLMDERFAKQIKGES